MNVESGKRYIECELRLSMKELKQFPRYIFVETVNSCNAKCIMCGIDFSKKSKTCMNDTTFLKIANEIKKHSHQVNRITLTLDGEPLIDPNLAARVKQMRNTNVCVNVTTNASLLTSARAQELIVSGLNEIYFTLDSLQKQTYEKIRPGLNFDTVNENILNFIKLRNQLNPELKIRLQMIEQELNQGEGDSFKSHWTPLLSKNDQIAIQKVHNWGSKVDVVKYGDEACVNDVPCISLFGTCVIHVDGTMSLCCVDSECRHVIGNIREHSIEQLWQNKVFTKFRQLHLTGKRNNLPLCNKCTLWRPQKRSLSEIK